MAGSSSSPNNSLIQTANTKSSPSTKESSCSFKTQIKYQDGSLGCLEDLPIANQIATGDNRKIVDKIASARGYAVARSKNLACNALVVETSFSSNIVLDFLRSSFQQKTLAQCNSLGCDCEIVLVDGNALVSRDSLMTGGSLSPPSNSPQANQLAAINPPVPAKQITPVASSSCKFKNQIKYQDGSVSCLEDLPIANQIPKGQTQELTALVSKAFIYAIAQSIEPNCNSIGFNSTAFSANRVGDFYKNVLNNIEKEALASCKSGGCNCQLIASDGNALVSKEVLLAGSSSSSNNSQIQTANIKPSTSTKESSCSFKTQIKYQDGTEGCIDDLPMAKVTADGGSQTIIELIGRVQNYQGYAVASSKSPICKSITFATGPINPSPVQVSASLKALQICREKGCDCEVIINAGNALLPKNVLLAVGAIAATNDAIAQQTNSSDSNNRLAEANRLKQEEALKTATAQEKLKLELAQKQKEQQELAKKQQLEKEQKIAEEKRAQQDLAKQQQLEREQKLAEQKRLQAEMVAKAQTEKEQKFAEEKRKQDEFVAKIQAEKEQKELVLRQKKEADQQAQAQFAAQAPKASYVGKRLALVIGNSKYTQRPLDNAVNDANDVSKALKNTGFEVIDVRDATLSQMRTALRQFGDKLLNNDVGLVYYSGHGVEVKGRNYFIPVNADIKRSDEIADQSLDVGLVLDKMETAQKAVNILIVDACRDDPFGRSFRSGSRGLATMDAPQGTIIAFATSPGKVAADGDGRNSPYTKNLVVAMQEPNLPIEQVFKQVRRAVQKETKGQQTPWENTSLSGDFYFKVQK